MTSATTVKIRLMIATPIPQKSAAPTRADCSQSRAAGQSLCRAIGRDGLVLAEPVGDDARTGRRPLLGLIAVDATVGGILAIDRAVVGETAGVIVEQHLMSVTGLSRAVADTYQIDVCC